MLIYLIATYIDFFCMREKKMLFAGRPLYTILRKHTYVVHWTTSYVQEISSTIQHLILQN